MKSIFLILTIAFIAQATSAQSKFKAGVNYNIGTSTYYGSKMNSIHGAGNEMPVYALKISNGMGVKFLYNINDKFALTLNTASNSVELYLIKECTLTPQRMSLIT